MVRIIGPRDVRNKNAINVTSCSTDWGKCLSPMILGPVDVPKRDMSKNVENAWQYSKVYKEHLTPQGDPNILWRIWSSKGYNKNKGERYPMGKASTPEYAYWNGEKLDYIEAREKIYIPIYMEAAIKTPEYKHLYDLYKEDGTVTLWDFDGYDYTSMGKTIDECRKDHTRPLGHAFVLAMMLYGDMK